MFWDDLGSILDVDFAVLFTFRHKLSFVFATDIVWFVIINQHRCYAAPTQAQANGHKSVDENYFRISFSNIYAITNNNRNCLHRMATKRKKYTHTHKTRVDGGIKSRDCHLSVTLDRFWYSSSLWYWKFMHTTIQPFRSHMIDSNF